jgi:dipeptidyl aminopeptidase/acylaminoacyl peptidase
MVVGALAAAFAQEPWSEPPPEIAAALEASVLPEWWTLPGGRALEVRPVLYPPLAELARPMLPLAGVRVDVERHAPYRDRAWVDPVLVDDDGRRTPLPLPEGRRLRTVTASADGSHLAVQLSGPDGIELWTWRRGELTRVGDLLVDPLFGSTWSFLPDQTSLVVKTVPAGQGPLPARPAVPVGPEIRTARGATASSTYEARDLLTDAWSDEVFTHFATTQLVVVDTDTGAVRPLGTPGVYAGVSPSPDGAWLLVERLQPPWSHRVIWDQFARTVEVWTLPDGAVAKTLATLPAAEQIPIHGVATGMRSASWQASAPATLVWLEALDGGDWSVEVPHRDRMLARSAPFDAPAREVYLGTHRIQGWWWGRDGLLVVEEYERARRWRHVRTVDVDDGPASTKPWFDLSRNDRYADPGDPVLHTLPDGRTLLAQDGDAVFYSGVGGTPEGDRPFLDRRSLDDGTTTRLWRSAADRYERFRGFVDERFDRLWILSESWQAPPNLSTLSSPKKVKGAPAGEATLAWKARPVTAIADPAPELRRITRETVTYTRADGVPLSFVLYLPPGWKSGDRPLPTVLHAYPREFSDPVTAGQITGSDQQFLRLTGPTPLFFALHGYAVLDNTTMPVLGDPDTAYDTFVPQLVASAQAAIDEAVRRGVTDRDRVGVTGHSHGGLMTATLLAHSDLFKAGIARSGAYNHTIRPFGFQSERRTLWEAKETYLGLSPVMFAPQLREPILIIHGARDENPGTIPFQSERLFEAIRGAGGTARWLSLPYEGHGYVAEESVKHVLAEQLAWFDRYVRDMNPP